MSYEPRQLEDGRRKLQRLYDETVERVLDALSEDDDSQFSPMMDELDDHAERLRTLSMLLSYLPASKPAGPEPTEPEQSSLIVVRGVTVADFCYAVKENHLDLAVTLLAEVFKLSQPRAQLATDHFVSLCEQRGYEWVVAYVEGLRDRLHESAQAFREAMFTLWGLNNVEAAQIYERLSV